LLLLAQFAVAIAEAVLIGRPRVALGLPHLFEDLAVASAVEARRRVSSQASRSRVS
jgi:hypothetical protein